MAQTIQLKRSATAGNKPTSSDLALGEIAINTADGAVYIKKGNNDIVAVHDNDILHIDTSNSRVGIGTTSPSKTLDVNGSIKAFAFESSGGGNKTLTIGSSNDGTYYNGLIVWNQYNTSQPAHRLTASSGGGSHYEYGRGMLSFIENQGSDVTRMVIKQGNVGIGTSSPVAKLDVAGDGTGATVYDYRYASSDGIRVYGEEAAIDLVGTDSGNHASSILMRNTNAGFALLNTASGDSLEFRSFTATADDFLIHSTGTSVSNLSTILTLEKAGNVGIGTTSPSANLAIVDGGSLSNTDGNNRLMIDTSGHSYILLNSPDGYDQGIHFRNNTDGSLVGRIAYAHRSAGDSLSFRVAGSDRLVINSSGALTFNSAYTFPTSDGSANQVLQTDGSGNLSFATVTSGGGSTDSITDADGDTKIQVEESTDEDQIRFDAGGTERFRIGSDVQVLAATDFNITGTSRRLNFTAGSGTVRTTTANSLILATNNTTALTINSSQNATFAGDIYLYDTKGIYLGGGNDLQLYHNGSHSLITNQTGDLYIRNQTNDGDIIFQADDGAGGDTEYLRLDGGIVQTVASKHILFNDNVQGRFGDAADLQILHDASDSFLINNTGDLYIRNNTDDGDIKFQSDDGSGGLADYFSLDGSNARNRFHRNVLYGDGIRADFGDSSDLKIYHDGSHSYITDSGTGDLLINATNLRLRNVGGVNMLYGQAGGWVKIYYNGSEKFETTNTGVNITGITTTDGLTTSANITLDDARIKHNNTTFSTFDWDGPYQADSGKLAWTVSGTSGAEMELSSDGSDYTNAVLTVGGQTVLTQSAGINLTGNLGFNDNVKALFGTNHDLQIFHDGSNSLINESGVGGLVVRASNYVDIQPSGGGAYMGRFLSSGAVELYHNGSKKFETKSDGVDITGELQADSLDIDGNATISGWLNFDGGDNNGLLRIGGSNVIGKSNNWLYIDANTSFSSGIYINNLVKVDGGKIGSYNEDLQLRTANTTALTLSNTDQSATFVGSVEATSFSDGTISGITFIDEDSFATNSATRVPTQQSIKAYVDAQVAGVVDSAPSALNTLNELAAALGDDANFSTTTSTALGNRLRVDTASQGLTGTQQANAITNLGITATKAELNLLDGVTATTTELNYTDGVTSNIQAQLNGKLSTSGTAVQATNLNATDDRDIAPEDLSYTDDFRIYFAEKGGLETGTVGSNYQDVLVLNSYSDSSGGSANALAFDKSEKKIYHYQAGQSATNWGTAKTLAYTDDITLSTLSITATATELNYTDGVTSNIQTQLNGKVGTSGNETITGNKTFTGSTTAYNLYIDNNTTNYIRMYTENNTTNIADTFTDTTTDKSYIYFGAGDSSNDPGFIMHETSEASSPNEQNEGVLHLVPSDDNATNDYVSIHGTNDADCIRLHTSGLIETGSNHQLTIKSGSGDVYINDALTVSGHSELDGGVDVTGNIIVTGTVDGRDVASDGSKLDGIESGATADQTASEILTAIKTVDGSGSGLDADTLDGTQASGFHTVTSSANNAGNGNLSIGYDSTNLYSYVQSHGSKPLRLNPVGNAVQIGSGNTVWHAGNDGASSGLDADLLDGQHGSYYAAASSLSSYLPLSGGTMTGTLNMSNGSINGLNNIQFNDPGPNEGLSWSGGNIKLYESPDDLTTNSAGNLQVVYGSTRRLTVTNTGVDVNGALTATTKSFDIEHPSKEGMRLRYGSLEGPENGVYVRGKSKEKVISLPDYWVDLVHEDSITVQLTAIGKGQDLYVEKIEDNKVYVNGENYFYYILAERKDVERFEVEYGNSV